MSIRLSVFRNIGAAAWCRISGALCRLIQVPLLLSALGVDDFGRWLVLYSIPSWLMLANMGFGSVSANEISMAIAANDMKSAKSVFSTTIGLVIIIGVCASLITAIIAPFVPWSLFLNVPQARHQEMALAMTWLAISIFISFFTEALQGRFRAARKAHISVLILSFSPWLDLSGIIIALHFSKRFDHMAFSLLIATVIYFLIYLWLSWRAMPTLTFSIRWINLKGFKYLFKKGTAFQAFPLGNALLFQGNLLIVQTIIGPAAVAVFGTVRTLVRTVNQIMEIINQAIWPEITYLFGINDIKSIAKLHRTSVSLSIITSSIGVVILAFFGQTIYAFWVGKSIELPQHLLLMFLLPIPFNALWFTSSVIHLASNKHEGLAARYLLAACFSAIACVVFSYFQGIEGAAASTLIFDVILIPYVLKRSLFLTADSWKEFIPGILKGSLSALSSIFKFVRFPTKR